MVPEAKAPRPRAWTLGIGGGGGGPMIDKRGSESDPDPRDGARFVRPLAVPLEVSGDALCLNARPSSRVTPLGRGNIEEDGLRRCDRSRWLSLSKRGERDIKRPLVLGYSFQVSDAWRSLDRLWLLR